MIKRRLIAAAGLLLTATLALTACGSSAPGDASAGEAAGDPVAGGTAVILQNQEPAKLDPVVYANSWANNPITGNAIFGQLLIDTPEGELELRMLEEFSSADGGKTFVVKLKEGIEFSDGTVLDAAAIKYNWDRIKNPETGAADKAQAEMIESIEIADPLTLTVHLVERAPNFPHAVLQTTLNWVANPAVLDKGEAISDTDPIGAGPFVVTSWARQDVMKLERNDNFYGEPAYLDAIEIRPVADQNQRLNTVQSGGAQLSTMTAWDGLGLAEEAGLKTEVLALGGGVGMLMNESKAPFDDERARLAFAQALDLDVVNASALQGFGEVPKTLFPESSPFFADVPLPSHDPESAQKLFDELADEGKPVEFTMRVLSTHLLVAEAMQAQLSAFDNVTVRVEQLDPAVSVTVGVSGDFQATVSTYVFSDPEPRLYFGLRAGSSSNFGRVDDAALNEALDQGRVGETQEERKAAYDIVQERFSAVVPSILYARAAPGVIAAANVHGIHLYGMGSALPDEIWIQP